MSQRRRIPMATSQRALVAVVTLLTAIVGRAQMQMVPSRTGPSSSLGNSTGQTRNYYVAADDVMWDYAPGGVNQVTGKAFGEAESFWVAAGPHQVGKVFKKALYREYADATFRQLKPRPKEWEHLGYLGPLLRA